MNNNTPRRKRFKSHQRLQSGKSFIEKYQGKNLVKGYSKWYGVDKLCAILELRELGVEIPNDYEVLIKKNMIQNDKKQDEENSKTPKFTIVGETSNGVPFGIIYDEEVDYLDEQMNLYE